MQQQQQQFEQLKNDFSLEVPLDTEFYWDGEVRNLIPLKSTIEAFKNDRVYSTGSGVLTFIHEGKMFVTPDTTKAINILRGANYYMRAFFVPLAPKGMSFKDTGLATRWQELMSQANIIRRTAQDMRERRAELAQQSRLSAQAAVATA